MSDWKAEKAAWIWPENNARPLNAYFQFRKCIYLDRVPENALIRASADCRYILYINGKYAGRGPVLTDPKYKQVDAYDVTELLAEGENVISALLLQRHSKTSRLWPVRGGFICRLDCGGTIYGTDDTWKVRHADEYRSDPPYMTHQYGHQEWLDGRKMPIGWQFPGYDDKDWERASVIEDPGRYWPETLQERTIPHMLRVVRRPVRIVSFFGVSNKGVHPDKECEPAKQLFTDYILSSVTSKDLESLTGEGMGKAVIKENTGDGVGLVVDLGEEMLGYPYIELECAEGATVDLGHGEVLSRNRIQTLILPESGSEQRYADRYYTRKGRQRWEIFDTKGCRYLEVHIRHLPKEDDGAVGVAIYDIGVVESRSPDRFSSEFLCSDGRINSVFDICSRTARVKHQDLHICDASREQNQWLEMYQDMLYLQKFGRSELLRQTIDNFTHGQLSSGFMQSTLPSIYSEEAVPGNQYIFTTYMYPLIVYLDWLYGGEDPRQGNWISSCERVFEALNGFTGSDGIVRNAPGSQWVEWSGLDARPGDCAKAVSDSWEVAFYNALLVIALECMAKMAEAKGLDRLAGTWRMRASGLRQASGLRYWSDEREAFVDGIYDGSMSASVSQTTNAAAVLGRLLSHSFLVSALETASDSARCDVPSALNGMALFHEALESMDMDQTVPERIRSIWGKMIDQGATTTWEACEALERSQGCCFGFSSHPFGYMMRNFLGVVPTAPGYGRFSVRIAPSGLKWANGKAATPRGMIEISWTRRGKCISMNLFIPCGCTADIAVPRIRGWTADNTAIVIDGTEQIYKEADIASCSFITTRRPSVSAGAGRHTVLFRHG